VEDVSSERVSIAQIYLERTRSLAEVGSASLVSSSLSSPSSSILPLLFSLLLRDLISPTPNSPLTPSYSLRLLLPRMDALYRRNLRRSLIKTNKSPAKTRRLSPSSAPLLVLHIVFWAPRFDISLYSLSFSVSTTEVPIAFFPLRPLCIPLYSELSSSLPSR